MSMADDLLRKLLRADDSAGIAALPRPMVFTNGVFDILHRGHVACLVAARALGASLVVGLNSDASARGLGKGPDRPMNRELDRAVVLGALACGMPLRDAAAHANRAAGIVVSRFGTAAVTLAELNA